MALRQTLQLFTGTEMETPARCVSGRVRVVLTAPWPARQSRGPRCPFCSGPSSAPAEPGWASVPLLLQLQNTGKSRAGGDRTGGAPPLPSLLSLCFRRVPTPAASLLTGSRRGWKGEGPSLLPTSRQKPPPWKAEHKGRYLLHTGWSSAARDAWQTQFSHRPPAERTETWGLSLPGLSKRYPTNTSCLSHQEAGITVTHTHWTQLDSHGG